MTLTDPVAPALRRTEPAPTVPTQRPSTSFAEHLAGPARPDGPPAALMDAVRSLERGQRFVDRVIRQALCGRSFSQDELLAVQAGVYRYTQELELFSRMVEKAVAGMKQTLGTQT